MLGGGVNGLGGRGVPGVFPAKYNFDITAAPSCANDFAVYPTNAAGNTSSGAEETSIRSFTGDPGQGANRTVTVGATAPRRVVLTSHATDNTGLNFRTAGVNDNTRATNLGEAINRWSHQTGLRAEVVGAQVTVYSNTVGNVPNNAMSEALDNFDGNSLWPGSDGSGTPGQPTIIAFNQLYQALAPQRQLEPERYHQSPQYDVGLQHRHRLCGRNLAGAVLLRRWQAGRLHPAQRQYPATGPAEVGRGPGRGRRARNAFRSSPPTAQAMRRSAAVPAASCT
ncbi:hypothetical protein [Thermomonas sp.]|uniref:hypothetical protein n=1 Tax=Thermomonas sp. TaxID=1971895 RepID=UPI00260BB079|nr:hypothetical protein [Thermomonas sp.]MBL0227572.1 hypothetical protein [Thermomonas sp.]